jgi:hypothetical protein
MAGLRKWLKKDRFLRLCRSTFVGQTGAEGLQSVKYIHALQTLWNAPATDK